MVVVGRWTRMMKTRSVRKPAAILGAACTSAFFGLLFLNKVLLNSATCVASCATTRYLSYERLQKNEASRKVKPAHSTVKNFEVNFLPSNSPIEDRFVAGVSPSLGAAMFSVIDGHKGFRCSEYLQKHLLRRISDHLHKAAKTDETTHSRDLQILLDMHHVTSNTADTLQEDETRDVTMSSSLPQFSESSLEHSLREAFVSLDNTISSAALEDIKWVRQGHSFTEEFKERVLTAVEGACAIATIVMDTTISVSSTGDCRVVVGRKLPDGAWQAVPLSVDQNAQNPSEVERLRAAHPGEDRSVIFGGRVLGSLMPFRTFGDVDFKWEVKHLNGIVPTLPFYYTPPYITAEPVVTHHNIEKGDKFMILASDGLWERISNEKAVEIVAKTIGEGDGGTSNSLLNLFKRREKGGDMCCHGNAATELLWHALGGSEENVTELLDIPPPVSRMYRDDITVMIVYFKD